MTVDLLGTIRLLHKVLGFLADQSADQLADIASGRSRLALTADGRAEPVPGPRAPIAGKQPERPGPVPVEPTAAEADFAEIAAMLRKQESVDDGLAYLKGVRLRGKKLLKADLLTLAKAMNLSLPKSTNAPEITRRLLEHAIGVRTKYAGLDSW